MVPRVSVLMAVYNGEKYIKEAIESILSQSYTDFEFLIIDDGSTDNSVNIIKSFPDQRIRLVYNKKNIGLANSLNKGVKLAQGEYIVRMDADDISLPERIKIQVEYMDKYPEIGISGAWIEHITRNNKNKIVWRFETDHNRIRFLLLFFNPMGHNSVIMRKKQLVDNNLFYRSSYETAEDYDLWVRASCLFPLTNISDVLVLYRRHNDQVGIKNAVKQKQIINLIIMEQLKKLNLKPTKEEWDIHNHLGRNRYNELNSHEVIVKTLVWLDKLHQANLNKEMFEVIKFQRFLSEKWFKVCYHPKQFGLWSIKIYYSSRSINLKNIGFKHKAKIIINGVLKNI